MKLQYVSMAILVQNTRCVPSLVSARQDVRRAGLAEAELLHVVDAPVRDRLDMCLCVRAVWQRYEAAGLAAACQCNPWVDLQLWMVEFLHEWDMAWSGAGSSDPRAGQLHGRHE